eukprot:gene34180-42143_t
MSVLPRDVKLLNNNMKYFYNVKVNFVFYFYIHLKFQCVEVIPYLFLPVVEKVAEVEGEKHKDPHSSHIPSNNTTTEDLDLSTRSVGIAAANNSNSLDEFDSSEMDKNRGRDRADSFDEEHKHNEDHHHHHSSSSTSHEEHKDSECSTHSTDSGNNKDKHKGCFDILPASRIYLDYNILLGLVMGNTKLDSVINESAQAAAQAQAQLEATKALQESEVINGKVRPG